MKLRTNRVCNKDSIRKCDIPCVAASKHCDYVSFRNVLAFQAVSRELSV